MKQDFNIALGAKIREARLAAGLLQKNVASAISVSQSGFALYESGHRGVDIPTLLSIAQATNHPLEFFLGEYARNLHAVDDELVTIVEELEAAPEYVPEVSAYIEFLRAKEKVA